MSSTPDEFRAKTRKIVTLPSGLIVEIRKIRQRDLIEVGDLLVPIGDDDAPAENAEMSMAEKLESRDKTDRYVKRAIVAGAVSPAMSDRDIDKNNPDVVCVFDLDEKDFYCLAADILAWSGISKEAGQAAEQFRTDAEQGSGGRHGPTIQ